MKLSIQEKTKKIKRNVDSAFLKIGYGLAQNRIRKFKSSNLLRQSLASKNKNWSWNATTQCDINFIIFVKMKNLILRLDCYL